MWPRSVETGHVFSEFLGGRRTLELIVDWPPFLTDLDMLHKKWLFSSGVDHIRKYHPKYLEFECTLKVFFEHKSDSTRSKAHLLCPFPVETQMVSNHNLDWKDRSSRVVYIVLKSHSEDYAILRVDG